MSLNKNIVRNIFDTESLPDKAGELFDTLLERKNNGKELKLERIFSFGATTPEGEWYDQSWDEWVMVVMGEAVLEYGDGEKVTLSCGDHLLIPARQRHRVAFTSTDCVWLALHFDC